MHAVVQFDLKVKHWILFFKYASLTHQRNGNSLTHILQITLIFMICRILKPENVYNEIAIYDLQFLHSI